MYKRNDMCVTDYALPHDEIAHAIEVTEVTHRHRSNLHVGRPQPYCKNCRRVPRSERTEKPPIAILPADDSEQL